MDQQAVPVSDIVNAIKVTLEFEYSDLTVIGEITNLSSSAAGHYYFNLSDDKASLSAALFRMDANRNPVIRRLKDGDKVIVRGPISVYPKRGTFQILAKRILPFGKGDLKAQFEMLKRKLGQEGLFDPEHKVNVPRLPKKVAVITAKGGAALQDFLNIMKRRTLWHDILIVPCTAQGDDCAPSVIRALDKISKRDDVDVVVITRGGGSIEDLWGYNDENLVRKVFDFKLPVISAIGHQVDFTLLDFVADMRCETPSAAAEVLSQDQTQLAKRLDYSVKDIRNLFYQFQNDLMRKIETLNPTNLLHLLKENLYQAKTELSKLDISTRVNLIGLDEKTLELDDYITRITNQMRQSLIDENNKLDSYNRVLTGLNPRNVLGRGYSMLQTKKGKVLTSLKEFDSINSSEELNIEFADGVGSVVKK